MMLKFCLIILLMIPINYSLQIRFHEGFVLLNQKNIMMSPNFTADQKYTFEIFSQNTEEEDFLPYSCFLNDHKFLDEFGCLKPSSFILSKYETSSYNTSESKKQLMVRFIAPSDELVFKCGIYIFECSGCAANSCENQPNLNDYESRYLTVSCDGSFCKLRNYSNKESLRYWKGPTQTELEYVKAFMEYGSLPIITLVFFVLLVLLYRLEKFRRYFERINELKNSEEKTMDERNNIEMGVHNGAFCADLEDETTPTPDATGDQETKC